MIEPRSLRELSWAAAKLREVAKTLSALEVRLTVGADSDRMAATGNCRTGDEEHETPRQGVLALSLTQGEQNALLRRY